MSGGQIEHPRYARLLDTLELIAPSEGKTILTAVVKLHRPIPTTAPYGTILWHCDGCDPGDHAEGPADGPCATLRKIADLLGVAL